MCNLHKAKIIYTLEDSSLAFTGITSNGLLIVNLYRIIESVTSSFSINDVDYSFSQNLG
ncbi:MAG: hypothetical protein VW080_02275 [Flavobacteriaceae bacterium]